MVDDFVKELTNYYKPHSPLEVLQIQRIALCRAKLAKLIDIEIAGRELYRREVESHPELVFEKLTQYSDSLRYLATLELRGQSILKSLYLDKTILQNIAKEITDSVSVVESDADFPNLYPKLCAYLKKAKFFPEQSDELGWDHKLSIFAEVIRVKGIGSQETKTKAKLGSFEATLLEMNRMDELVSKSKLKHQRSSQNDKAGYLRLVQQDFNVITDLANSVSKLKSVLQSYEEMKSWMLRSVDLNAQESERMMRYQTMLEKRLSTAIGELLELQKLNNKSDF